MSNLHETQQEIWNDVPGYEKIYQASTLGRIRSLDRRVPKHNGKANCNTFYKGKMLKPFPNRDGYLLIYLCDNCVSAHVVIASTFLGPKPETMIVLHDNNNKKDNMVSNLRYGTYSENTKDAISDNLYIHGRTGLHGSKNPQSKAVQQLDSNGNVISCFQSSADAAKKLKISQGAISNACSGRAKSGGGFRWRYL